MSFFTCRLGRLVSPSLSDRPSVGMIWGMTTTRERILDTAELRFVRQGFSATTVAQLIDDAQVAKGTFYHHFTSKEEVMTAVIERQVAGLVTSAEQIAADRSQPALARAARIVSGGLDRPATVDQLGEELERSGNELMRLRALDATCQALLGPLRQCLAEAVTNREIDPIDPEPAAATLLLLGAHAVDRDLFGWSAAGDLARLVPTAERLLGARPGALAQLLGPALTGPRG